MVSILGPRILGSVSVGWCRLCSRDFKREVSWSVSSVWQSLAGTESPWDPWIRPHGSIALTLHTASLPGSTSSRDQDHKINHENSLGLMSPSSTTWHREYREYRDNVWDVRDAWTHILQVHLKGGRYRSISYTYARCQLHRDERGIERRLAKSEFWRSISPTGPNPFKGLVHSVVLISTVFNISMRNFGRISPYLNEFQMQNITTYPYIMYVHAFLCFVSLCEVGNLKVPPETIAKHPTSAESFSFFGRPTPAPRLDPHVEWAPGGHPLHSLHSLHSLHMFAWLIHIAICTCNWLSSRAWYFLRFQLKLRSWTCLFILGSQFFHIGLPSLSGEPNALTPPTGQESSSCRDGVGLVEAMDCFECVVCERAELAELAELSERSERSTFNFWPWRDETPSGQFKTLLGVSEKALKSIPGSLCSQLLCRVLRPCWMMPIAH